VADIRMNVRTVGCLSVRSYLGYANSI